MSAYVVSDKTISVIAEAMENYGVEIKTDYKGIGGCGWIFDVNEIRQATGQRLLDENYRSVNYRYGEDTKPREFVYEPVGANEGELLGCIRCYEYQTCETPDYKGSEINQAMELLKEIMLERYIKKDGYEIGWGLD